LRERERERERERKKIPGTTTRFGGLLHFEEDGDVARLDVHEQIHAARRKRTRVRVSSNMLSSSSRKERKERKERKKREKKDVLDGASDATGSSVVSSEGTHDSAQTTGMMMVSPVGKADDSSEMQSTEAANISGESTTTGSTAAREDAERKKKTQSTSTEKKESLVQKPWFRVVAGTACSIAILSTGTKLLMNKEEKVEVKEDVATPAAGKKKKK
tara:strand:- start:1294 stop:1941 length:648 start_codon:yes stop_codon:yes gene_type:complete